MLCTTSMHSDTHPRDQFLNFCMLVRFRLFVCVYLVFVSCVFFHYSLGHVVLVLLDFVVLVSSVLS